MSRISSVYLTDEEHQLLDETARARNVSRNSLQRIGLRKLLGLPVPPWAEELYHREEEKTAV